MPVSIVWRLKIQTVPNINCLFSIWRGGKELKNILQQTINTERDPIELNGNVYLRFFSLENGSELLCIASMCLEPYFQAHTPYLARLKQLNCVRRCRHRNQKIHIYWLSWCRMWQLFLQFSNFWWKLTSALPPPLLLSVHQQSFSFVCFIWYPPGECAV